MAALVEEPFDLVLILSVIKTPRLPLSYTWKRSSFSHDGRWKQTLNTFRTVKHYLPNAKVMMVECSDLDEESKKLIQEVYKQDFALFNYEI